MTKNQDYIIIDIAIMVLKRYNPLGLAGDCLKNSILDKNGVEIESSISKGGQNKKELLFNNKNDAKNFASEKLGLDKTRMFNKEGKWIGWKNSAEDEVYWGHDDWGNDVGKSTYPHLNYNIKGEKEHLHLRNTIINRGEWNAFSQYFGL